jgi:hypothetical protein
MTSTACFEALCDNENTANASIIMTNASTWTIDVNAST